jgi:hypothetical protein
MFVGISVGALQPPHPALAGLSACTSLCWHGIRPGVTSLDAARDIAEAQGDVYSQGYQPRTVTYSLTPQSGLRLLTMRYDNRIIESLAVIPRESVALGDLMVELGEPDGVLINPNYTILLYRDGKLGITISYGPDGMSALSMFQREILSIFITAERIPSLRWHGFAPTWRYCQLEKGAYGCR